MKLYYRTYHAKEILAEGFKDTMNYYGSHNLYGGVWFSNNPLDANEGADGDSALMIEIPVNLIKQFEWVEVGKPYREWCVPAKIVNRYPLKLLKGYQLDRMIRHRFMSSD
jgi:hypothetical protein